VIAMDQRLDFSPGDKPDVGKTATLELTPKQSEIVTLAVKMGEVSLALRSLQDPDEKGGDEDAPAEPGDSFTHDAQVSHLIKPMDAATPAAEPAKQVLVMHGGNTVRQNIDGSPVGGDSAPTKEDKPANNNATPFTRTIASEPQ
jgi:pilus assembly protein CpaB